MIFVGRLDDNKNLMSVLKMLPEFGKRIASLTIVGGGPLEDKVRRIADATPGVEFLGTVANAETKRLIARHDLMILPSKYDGWGAVVNEALSEGTRVLCSVNCGAAVLLDGQTRGEAFRPEDMREVLGRWIAKGRLSFAGRTQIKEWACKHISGEAAAGYFVRCFDVNSPAPTAPWMEQTSTGGLEKTSGPSVFPEA